MAATSKAHTLGVEIALTGLQKVEAGLAVVRQQVAAAGATLRTAAVAGAALLGLRFGGNFLGGIHEQVRGVVRLGSELARLSRQTQVSVSRLVALQRAFTESGVEASDLGRYLRVLSKAVGNAALDSGSAAKAIEGLGLSAAELVTLSPDRQFVLLASKIGAIENPTLRAAIAMQIFGESATEILPLFGNPDLLRGVSEDAGRFGAVMERNADRLHVFEVAIRKVGRIGTGIFAGIVDQLPLDAITQAIHRALTSIDPVGIGQSIGAFVQLVIDRWNAGRIGELISLTIDAGFEAGALLAGKVWEGLKNLIASPGFWKELADVVVTTSNAMAKALLGAVIELETPLGAAVAWLGDQYRFTFESAWEAFRWAAAFAINFAVEKLEPFLNAWKTVVKAVVPGMGWISEKPIQLGRLETRVNPVAPPRTWAESMAWANQRTTTTTRAVGAFFDSNTAAMRQVLGVGGDPGLATGERLKVLLAEINALVAARAGHEERARDVSAGHLPILNRRAQLESALRRDQEDLQRLESVRTRAEANFAATAAEKWRLKKAALEGEAVILRHTVALLREKAALETDPGAREQLLGRADAVTGRLGQTEAAVSGLGPNPHSIGEQMASGLARLQDQFGTVAENIARTFVDVIGTAVNTVSEGITALILGTKTWGQALRSIYNAVLTSLIQGIVQMGVQWVLTHVIMKGVTLAWHALLNALGWSQVAQTNAQESAKTPALATNAALASAGSYGTSAVVGIALLVAMIGVAIAAAAGAFAQGGLVHGPGGPTSDSILARLSPGEYVVPAQHVDRLGVGFFDAIRHGQTPTASPAGASQNVHVYLDRRAWLESVRDDVAGIAIDAMRRGRA